MEFVGEMKRRIYLWQVPGVTRNAVKRTAGTLNEYRSNDTEIAQIYSPKTQKGAAVDDVLRRSHTPEAAPFWAR